jgi:enhancer of mRNA-decapping protein 3
MPPPANAPSYPQYPPNHVQQPVPNQGPPMQHRPPQEQMQHASQPIQQPVQRTNTQPAPFVDPAILSMGKRTSTALPPNQALSAPPQEAPATPIKPVTGARNAILPKNTFPYVGSAKQRNMRKPSAATLEGPFSSLDIADAEEADSETKTIQPSLRRASINKTRNGKPMEDTSPQKLDDGGKKTRRGGKSRKKELAAQERKNGGDADGSLEGARKGYVHFTLPPLELIILESMVVSRTKANYLQQR